MLVIRFFHDEDKLYIGNKIFKASCMVRNELNGERKETQIVETWPLTGQRQPCNPRKFPTGLWRVKQPVWTDNLEYAPVKIPTDAVRRVLTWDIKNGKYSEPTGHQSDAFYHLHFARDSRSTLGCIRLNSASDATAIAKLIEAALIVKGEVWLEVIASRRCYD